MSRDYFDDGYDFTMNRITLPNGEAVLITPSRNKHRLYIADLPDRIKRRCLTLPTDDHFLDNGCDQHKLCEMDDDERIALVTEQARVAYPILPTIGLGVRTNPLAEAQPQMLTVRFRAALFAPLSSAHTHGQLLRSGPTLVHGYAETCVGHGGLCQAH